MNVNIGLDWGTTSLTAWKISGGHVIDTKTLPLGVMRINSQNHEEVLYESIGDWLDEADSVVGFGMLGSTMGIHPTKALSLPLSAEELVSSTTKLPDGIKVKNGRRLPLFILPGLEKDSTIDQDVMRGEETQALSLQLEDGIVLIPGTHSKWISIKNYKIVDFTTYLTGELFSLLSGLSTLSEAVQGSNSLIEMDEFFKQGLEMGRNGLTHSLFTVRARWLKGLPSQSSRNYLSGMLIGAEISHATKFWGTKKVHLISNDKLSSIYKQSLELNLIETELHLEETAIKIILKVIDRSSMVS